MEAASLIANVQGMTAIAVAMIIGMGALGTAIGAGQDVHRRRSARRGDHDRRRRRVVLHLRQPVPRAGAGSDQVIPGVLRYLNPVHPEEVTA